MFFLGGRDRFVPDTRLSPIVSYAKMPYLRGSHNMTTVFISPRIRLVNTQPFVAFR